MCYDCGRNEKMRRPRRQRAKLFEERRRVTRSRAARAAVHFHDNLARSGSRALAAYPPFMTLGPSSSASLCLV